MKLKTITVAALLAFSAGAQAAPYYWNTWSSTTAGTIAPPSGTVNVTFSGSSFGSTVGYPSWTPAATFADGMIVDNGPVAANGIMQLTGGDSTLNTVTFSTAVVDPVFSIWSLGPSGINASFVFTGLTPLLVSGGLSAEYAGSTIAVSGDTVSGVEGNGTVQFSGTYTSISWTNPVSEYWYGFNVGVTEAPEPGTSALLMAGLGLLGALARRKTRA